MITVKLSPVDAATYNTDEQAWQTRTRRIVYAECHALADQEQTTVELHHPDGFVVEAFRPDGQ